MSNFGNWVKETTTASGTGAVTVVGITGFTQFADEFADGDLVYYAILDGANRETGIGTVGTSGTVLTRTTVQATLTAGAYNDTTATALNLSGGTSYVYATANVAAWESLQLATLGTSTYTTLQDAVDTAHSTGVIGAHTITDDGDGTITVSAGQGLIRATDSSVDTLYMFDWPAEAGANVALTDNDLNYIYVEYNAGVPQLVATVTPRTDRNTNIFIGTVYRAGTTLHITQESAFVVNDHAALMVHRNQELTPFAHASGAAIGETGTRNISITAGTFWHGLIRYTTSAADTSVADTFRYYYQDGVGGFTEVTAQTQIDNLQYDDGTGTLATLGNSRYGAHWIYMGVDGDLYVVYGRGSYTLIDAEAAPIPANLPPHFEGHGRIIGKIIIQKSAAAFTLIESAFQTSFETGLPTDHVDLLNIGTNTHDQIDTHITNNPLNKLDGTTAPTANEDTGDGYEPGSRWIDVTNDKAYVCLDATSTAAVWTETTSAGGGAGTYINAPTAEAATNRTSGHVTQVSGSTTAVVDADELHYAPFWLDVDDTMDAFVLEVTVGGTNCRMALYDCEAGIPTTRVAVHNTSYDITTTGTHILTFDGGSTAVPAGWYFIAITSDGTPTLDAHKSDGCSVTPMGTNWNGAGTANQYSGLAKALTYAALADPADSTSLTKASGAASWMPGLRQG